MLAACFFFLDAFLHQIHTATQKLKAMEARVAEIMEKQVFSTLDDISNFYLFDIDEAFARTWVRALLSSLVSLHIVLCVSSVLCLYFIDHLIVGKDFHLSIQHIQIFIIQND